MPETLEHFQPRHVRQFEPSGATTANLLTGDVAGEYEKSPSPGSYVFVILNYSATRSDIPSMVDVLATRASEHIKLFSQLGLSRQSLYLYPNIRSIERTSRSEVMLPWDVHTADFKEHFFFQMLSELELEPVEDGVSHAVERLMQDVLTKSAQLGLQWIKASFHRLIEEEKDSAAAGLLQCIGRIKSQALDSINSELVTRAIGHENAEIREAAISVVEQSEDKNLLAILSEHNDPVPWLARYTKQVLSDLS